MRDVMGQRGEAKIWFTPSEGVRNNV